MNRISSLPLLVLLITAQAKAQPYQEQQPYDIAKERLLYTIGYAHLDTEWTWDYPTTINKYLPKTMKQNFRMFKQFPDYVFNFTGSRRYRMMKEYYPDQYKQLADYARQGRWMVSGSSVDEGEVNISSSESLIRQVLYGNNYFRSEFGKESVDYMLPDCFGFLCNLPTVFHHCGLKGFSTQKLTWRSAVGIPFNVGVWVGPDGNGVVSALNATKYNSHIEKRLDQHPAWIKRLNENQSKSGYAFDYRYYGIGDRGGSPRKPDVKNAIGSLNNSDANFRVLLTASDQIYKDITPEILQKLPTYSGDLLLIEHSSGSLTSQAFMKRMNRKNELLAQSAEQVAVLAERLGQAMYPKEKMSNAWELVLGSQFHDILPGTSIPKAYEYAWNDEFIAANSFASVLRHGVSAIAGQMNTMMPGKPVVVYNPVAKSREDVVTAELEYPVLPAAVSVFDPTGKEVPSQIVSRAGNKLTLIFLAQVPSAGLVVYDVREATRSDFIPNTLITTERSLENSYYKVTLVANGDILSIWDKQAGKELLSKPARLEFQQEFPVYWPAWNMDWKDRQKPPVDFMDKEAELKIIEQGPVRITLQVNRKGSDSEITQLYSLTTGESGKRLEVSNKINWQSKGVSLKAAFPFVFENKKATYNLGVGTIARGNNKETMFEVPFKEWMDLTDKSGKYGVSILEDCKYGADKPDNHTLRLTLLYTPGVASPRSRFIHQSTQDWGMHDVKYAIYAHDGGWQEGQSFWQAKFLNQPLLAFESPKHEGTLGQTLSMLSVDNPNVGLMAFKKMEQGDYYLVRVNELSGNDLQNIHLSSFGKIADAYEVDGQERKIGDAIIQQKELIFDLSHYTIRSFAVKFEKNDSANAILSQSPVDLAFDADVISLDDKRSDGRFDGNHSLPGELLPDVVVSEDIRFVIGGKNRLQENAVICRGQQINLPQGNYTRLYLLAAATEDTQADFIVDGQAQTLTIQKWTGYVGQYYNRVFSRKQRSVLAMQNAFLKPGQIAWFASHCHNAHPSRNEAYQYSYLYKYEITIPSGAKVLTLPDNDRIRVMAVTVAQSGYPEVKPLQRLFDDFQGNDLYKLQGER